MQQSSVLFLVALFLLAFTVMAASAASSAPGIKCATNSACRRWVCKLNRCGPLSDRGDICDEDVDCLPDRDLTCFENRCTRCPGETDCSGMDEDPVCANLSTNEDNCGACGNSCDDDELCIKGKCTGLTPLLLPSSSFCSVFSPLPSSVFFPSFSFGLEVDKRKTKSSGSLRWSQPQSGRQVLL